MKQKLKALAMLLICTNIITNIFAPIKLKAQEEISPIIYIGTKDSIKEISSQRTSTTNNLTIFSEQDIKNYTNVIIDEELLYDNQIIIRNALEENKRILILGEISEIQIQNYLGLTNEINSKQKIDIETENLTKIVQAKSNDGTVENIQINSIGKLIYQNQEGYIISNIYVQNINDPKMLERAIQYSFKHDYFGQIIEHKKVETLSLTQSNALFSWENLGTYMETYTLECATATSALGLFKYDKNPNAYGQYLGYVDYTIEIDVIDSWAIMYAEVEAKGATCSKIYDWGPEEQTTDSAGNITINLFEGAIGVDLDVKRKVKVTKEEGGINNEKIRLRYQPTGLLGIHVYEDDSMRIGAFAVTSQDQNAMLYSRGNFSLKMGQYDDLGINFTEGMTYTVLSTPLKAMGD